MKSAAQFLWPYLRKYRRGFLLGFGALAMKSLLGAALPLFMRAAIDALTAGRALRMVYLFCGLLVAASIVKGLFQYWMRTILIGIFARRGIRSAQTICSDIW
jgi:ATP-binding cassette subfamily B protein